MTEPSAHTRRGGAPVGYVTELDAVGAGAVMYLRMWSDGPEAQALADRDFAMHLGPQQGPVTTRALDQIMDICARYGRRPLMRHSLDCKCLGGDESCFATFVSSACEGDREDALLIAMNIVRADMAPQLADLAQTFGLALKRISLLSRTTGRKHNAQPTLH
ncbi:hypothetical protein [Psychromarinibacter sp. S121]|uniref:hypothetical protein n=1 Tax=Psychromarinibacter sp. S121 TaxID=3415127 RepID=UPI003C7B82C1